MDLKLSLKKQYHCVKSAIFQFKWMRENKIAYLPNTSEAINLINRHLPKDLYNQRIPDFQYNASSDGIMLSLIIPVYNEEKNIKKCFDALTRQNTKYQYELLIIDNASTDSSPQMLKQYANDDHVRIITITENHGGSVARNVGISQARGKYIGFIDSDDRVSLNYVQKLLETAISREADIVKCDYAFEVNGKIVNTKKKLGRSYTDGMGQHILEYDGYIWDAIYKRELWNNIRFPEDYWYEDIIMKLIIFRSCKHFVYIPDVLYYYYVNPASTSKVQSNNASIKCLEQYYLVKYYLKLSQSMNLENDIALYRLLLHELGDMLFKRINNIEEKYRKAVFVLSSELIADFRSKYLKCNYTLPKCDAMIEASFLDKSFYKWELAAQYKYHNMQI